MMTFLLAALLAGQDWADLPENAWVRISPREGRPIPRFGWEGSGAYDPVRGAWIHQGGHDGIPQGFALFTLDLRSGRWEQVFPDTSPPGSCCVDGANVFDPAAGRFVRFPGAALGHGWQWSRKVKLKSSPVWLYDPEARSWTNMRPPPYKEPEKHSRTTLGALNAGAAYDPNHEVSLSFGGQTSGGGTQNLFAYDAHSNHLERLAAENPPEPRDGHGICYDAANDAVVLFGSQYGNDERTWLYRYADRRWEPLNLDPRPPGRKGKTYSTIPKMAFDTLNQVSLCLTWDDATGEHQTWALDLAARRWTRMNPAKEPESSSSRSRNLAYAPEFNAFLLELSSKDRGPEIWAYRYRKGSARPSSPAPRVVTRPGGADLTWAPGAGEYRVFRARAEKAWETSYTPVAVVREPKFSDEGLEAGATYFYRIAAGDGPPGFSGRTRPRAPAPPIVSVLSPTRVEVRWSASSAEDIAGYNLYRGRVSVATVKKGEGGAWKDNDPEYAEPQIVAVRDITDLAKLNDSPLAAPEFVDTRVDLSKGGPEYRFAVHAYVVRAVNRLGTESGPSPYALTIPSEPRGVMCREKDGAAELRWSASAEKGVAGYHVYEISERSVTRITEAPVAATALTRKAGAAMRRYCVVAVDALGQEGQPSSPAWYNKSYKGFHDGDWHQ